jgi:hypothetical protein
MKKNLATKITKKSFFESPFVSFVPFVAKHLFSSGASPE